MMHLRAGPRASLPAPAHARLGPDSTPCPPDEERMGRLEKRQSCRPQPGHKEANSGQGPQVPGWGWATPLPQLLCSLRVWWGIAQGPVPAAPSRGSPGAHGGPDTTLGLRRGAQTPLLIELSTFL